MKRDQTSRTIFWIGTIGMTITLLFHFWPFTLAFLAIGGVVAFALAALTGWTWHEITLPIFVTELVATVIILGKLAPKIAKRCPKGEKPINNATDIADLPPSDTFKK